MLLAVTLNAFELEELLDQYAQEVDPKDFGKYNNADHPCGHASIEYKAFNDANCTDLNETETQRA